MPAKRAAPKRRDPDPLPKLTEIEQDLLLRMEQGYQFETDSFRSDPVLRKDEDVIRPASANRNTIEALRERGLITRGKSHDPLKLMWRKA